MPHNVRPMLARLVDAPFDRAGWLFEKKWDGFRAIAEVERAKVRLYSRNGLSLAETYPPVVAALVRLGHDAVLDGEIIALKNGRADFHALQRYREVQAPLQYVVFDLLYVDGRDLRGRPLRERKALLRGIIPPSDAVLRFSDHVEQRGTAFFAKMQRAHVEGMLAKEGDSLYREGERSGAWLKVKAFQAQEAIVVGFTAPKGSRTDIGALILAAYEGSKLMYVGRSGGGMTAAERQMLRRRLDRIVVATSPLGQKVPGVRGTITWVRPKYVVQVEFSEWTPEGRMRHPIYVGLRPDKSAKEVMRELAARATRRAR